ncbi:unnamed protein product [Lactuca saligna]|uniref:Uncharacterized protein n=1 Tax=Lactuca saligna TaxID=75948 RepID=A0AA35Y8Y1_LACSI|nr:unnamed protein product [Lactuca saligna]
MLDDLVVSPHHDYYLLTPEGKRHIIPWFLYGLISPNQPPAKKCGNCRYGGELARESTTSLMNVPPSCGSVRISFSGRTPHQVSEMLVKEFRKRPKVYIWDVKDPNPHMGHLAMADAFLITVDSVSMISEACTVERGMLRPFTGKENITETWIYPPLRDTSEAAEHVIKALAERGWKLHP